MAVVRRLAHRGRVLAWSPSMATSRRRLAALGAHLAPCAQQPQSAADPPPAASWADELRSRAGRLAEPSARGAAPLATRRFDEIDDNRPSAFDLPVHASEAELEQLVQTGFLLRPGLLSAAAIGHLGGALAEMARDDGIELRPGVAEGVFGGWGPRWLMERHPAFLELAYFQPIVSVVRAMLGPIVRVRHAQVSLLPLSWPVPRGHDESRAGTGAGHVALGAGGARKLFPVAPPHPEGPQAAAALLVFPAPL